MNIVSLNSVNDLLFELKLRKRDINLKLRSIDNPYHIIREKLDAEIIASIASSINGNVVEIGTHEGWSTFNIAANNPKAIVWTLNIHPDHAKESGILVTDILPIDKIGTIYKKAKLTNIRQILKNSKFWNPDNDKINDIKMIFIDGCHDTEFVYQDTKKLLKYLNKGSFILWHDFCPNMRDKFNWIDSVMKGVERLYKEGLLDQPIFHVKDSWIGVTRI